MSNYKSATVANVKKVENQIAKELEAGNYLRVKSPPRVVSSLGAVPKTNGSIRLIHDLSRPNGGVNAFVEDSSVSYSTVDYATSLMSPGCFLSKVDLKAAYRSVPIHPNNYPYTGLSWLFKGETERTFMIDSKLPFGSSKACKIFSTISDSIARMLRNKGVTVVNYLDDILIISKNKSQNWLELDCTVNLLTKLGLIINWDKVEPPSQSITFLGVRIDTLSRTLSLPDSKLLELKDLLLVWTSKRRASKKELLSLIGKLSWASRVVRGGRTFVRRLIDMSCKLKANHHRTWLNSESKADINWWIKGLELFHGFTKFNSDLTPPPISSRHGRVY